MGSVWIVTRTTRAGEKRYRVEYRLGGREARTRYGGSFKRKTDADERRRWIVGELAARRVPDLRSLEADAVAPVTFASASQRWLTSRLDDADGTKIQHRTSVNRAIGVIGTRPIDDVSAYDVAAMVAELWDDGEGLKPSYLRKILQATAMVFDHAGVSPNPARDKVVVRLPRDDPEEVQPPTADHVLAVFRLLPSRYRLPLLTLDATGMRVGELEQLEWGDVDEPRGRWRVARKVSKTRRARWVSVHPTIYAAVLDLCPRDDRTPNRRVFQGFGADRFRTAITRACTAAGIPTFSPHDLRHRRISLQHLGGVPWARIGEQMGQRSLAVTADIYTHVLVDEKEIDYESALESVGKVQAVPTSVLTSVVEIAD